MSVSETKNINALAHNIRYLRNKMGISQDEMARRLGIKRSNIAAYEIKNVEPRLRVILELSKFFNIDIKDLIQTPLNNENYDKILTSNQKLANRNNQQVFELDSDHQIENYVEKTKKLRQIFDGFKAFYNFKKDKMKDVDPQKQKLLFDIENFLQLMEHLLAHNNDLIKALSSNNTPSS
ncbi:MAG: helix-turn-helix domain-containing protein [Saprospiraceae bacterium]|nr:helix-turn-helix domain-containing protein [Saprospiraceae bacterium]